MSAGVPDSGAANPRFLRTVVLVTVVTAVGGFLFGFDNGSISGSVGFLQTRFDLTPAGVGWVTSSIIVGCIIGVVVAGRLSDAIGRKRVLVLTAAVFLVGALGEALAPNDTVLVLARILVGIGIGTETTIAPLYIAEVAPAHIRGRLVSFNQLFNTVGNLVVFSIAAVIANLNTEQWNVEYGWRVIFATGLVPAVLFIVLLRFIPESPRWLAGHGRQVEALAVLERLTPSAEAAAAQLAEIRSAQSAAGSSELRELLRPNLRRALAVGFLVALFQQITGINAIFYYAPEIFRSAGLPTTDALSSTVLIGVVLVGATLVSLWLIDRVGRRTLLVIGAAAMTVLQAGIGTVFLAPSPSGPLLLALVLGYVAFFAVSFGTVTYVIISEIFPTRVRGAAASVATFALWGGNFFVSQFFPILVDGIGSSATFYLFSAVCLLALVFVLSLVPETKGRSLEEIERDLHRASSSRAGGGSRRA